MRDVYEIVKKKISPKWLYALLLAMTSLLATTTQAQLKVGNNPTRINRSSVLELESTNQGFLLPRITDTTVINGLTPPDATMIYFADPATTNNNAGIYIRRTIAGVPGWYKLAYNADDKAWTMGGNTVDPSLFPKAMLGTLNQRTLHLVTNNLVRMVVDSASGKISITDSLAVGGPLVVAGKTTLDSTLYVKDTATFADHVIAQKNLQVTDTLVSKVGRISDSLYLTNLKGQSLLTTVLVHDTISGTVERRNLPADVFKGWTIGKVDTTSHATALERISGQDQDMDTLIIHGATMTAPGAITTGKQGIAGTKIIRDSLLVGGASTSETPTSTLQVSGSVSVNIETVAGSVSLTEKQHTIVAEGGAVITLPSPATTKGRIYIIKGAPSVNTSSFVAITGTIDNEVKTAADALFIYNAGTVRKLQSDGVSSWYLIN